MKLVGSKTEQEFRDVLVNSHRLLFEENSYQVLLQALKINFPDMKTAYFIKHIPEQCGDFYTMLIDIGTIVKIEISRDTQVEKPIVEIMSINDYLRGLSRIEQIKLAVALDLAKKDIQYYN